MIFQLVIYAGPNTNSRKVTEYGGNTLGYGSRSVLGTGWPKDLVKVKKKIYIYISSLTKLRIGHLQIRNLVFFLHSTVG